MCAGLLHFNKVVFKVPPLEAESLTCVRSPAAEAGVSFRVFSTKRCEDWSLWPQGCTCAQLSHMHATADTRGSHFARTHEARPHFRPRPGAHADPPRVKAATRRTMQPASRLSPWGGLKVSRSDKARCRHNAVQTCEGGEPGRLERLPDVAGAFKSAYEHTHINTRAYTRCGSGSHNTEGPSCSHVKKKEDQLFWADGVRQTSWDGVWGGQVGLTRPDNSCQWR